MEELIKVIEVRIKSHKFTFDATGDLYWHGKESEAIFILEKLKQIQDESNKI